MKQSLAKSPFLEDFGQRIQKGDSLILEGLWDAPKALLMTQALEASQKHLLVLTGASLEESRLFDDFRYFCGDRVLDFPAWETLPAEGIPPSPDVVGTRYTILHQILESSRPLIILTSLQACLQSLISPSDLEGLSLVIKKGMRLPFDSFLEQLHRMGYQKQNVAADKGEYAVRGGIVDVYPVGSPDPYRIEFWGDDVESLRTYDAVGQISISQVDECFLTPAQELELLTHKRKLSNLLGYLGKETLVVWDDLLAMEERYANLMEIQKSPSPLFSGINDFMKNIRSHQCLYFSQQSLLFSEEAAYSPEGPIEFDAFEHPLQAFQWRHPFTSVSDTLRPAELSSPDELAGEDLLLCLGLLQDPHLKVTFLCSTESDQEHLQRQLQELDIRIPGEVNFQKGYLSTGFLLRDPYHLLIPLAEVTHRYKIRRQKQRSSYHNVPSEMHSLEPGDTVVHIHHGIGRFHGIETRKNHEGIDAEFFLVEYASNSRLFVPMHQAHLISKYVGSHEGPVKLHSLGSGRWKKTKEVTEKAIMGYAAELLDIYAKRTLHGGHTCPPDGPDLQRFEEEFPYVETEDQVEAIRSLKEDMTSDKSMDRLVCGDVGYGKTEVAMRAAFKAVLDGCKQVAILVPTTVLALQHYENFSERMANWPIRVASLSRFSKTKQTRQTLEAIEKGQVDIVIGTHRLVSKDVRFKDLGLVIIDEEQRFGVKAKEHLKQLKTGVDCLTLSATPIPRTLYMSMMGARDLSVIHTPPQDRLPIKTVIVEQGDSVLQNAIRRELNRDGQVYVIHNRVDTLPNMAVRIQKLVPHAKVVMAHGQMSATEADEVFHAFKSGEANVLVATTIVESGIDIPNANTILIDRAHMFGLADLYQLRGRVGRWNRRAYAYFLVPKGKVLPEVAMKRLQALVDAGGFGGGMKVAMRDLEIRGAGDLLGLEQSGHVSAVGFHLYCKLLKRTIETLKGNLPCSLTDPKLEFPQDARLPPDYVNAESLRMDLYQRLGEAVSFDDVDVIWEEIKDRFGPPPEAVHWLYHISRIRVFASLHQFILVQVKNVSLVLERKQGKTTETHRALFKKPKDPKALESKVIREMKKMVS